MFTTTFTNTSSTNICYLGIRDVCYGYKYMQITDVTSSNNLKSISFNYIDIDNGLSLRSDTYNFNGSIPYLVMLDDYEQITFNKPAGTFSMKITFYNDPPVEGSTPSGLISITENGEYDVSSYATAVVEVPDTETIVYGDYHDDLVNIYNAIIICAAVALVIYFFYCIYRMIIKTTGVY